ncbi:DUF6036 family nucleotidyltransferase [Methylophilus sp. YYY-1]|uniref:DUF6036 family nucleotidyltransferase n=1 Tax=Methylophilus sp. YYY-1 TaxID=2682087 RepID=UPI0023B34ECC|nr:DUF6036 family nucleotidyltransferase [Methylophilus sp. YYY-1]MDF0378131.1 hypothetical protein [Methylophilus sp. YYY-1]
MFYLDLFAALQKFDVDYLLIGGLAVSLHGVERATMDVDITVAMQPENLEGMLQCAKALQLTPVAPVPLESLTNLALLRQWHTEKNMLAFALRTPDLAGVTIDILLFPPLDFNQMHTRAVQFNLGDVSVEVACVDDLIAMKRAAGRPIDLSDIEHLEKIKSL